MNITLDRLRSFGSIHPPEYHAPSRKTLAYEQDGFFFDARGQIIEEVMDEAQREKVADRIAKDHALAAGRKAYEEAMLEQGITDFVPFSPPAPPKKLAPLSATDVVNNPNEIRTDENDGFESKLDLVAWATGKIQARWFAVAKAMREQHGASVANKPQALAWLVENGKISADAISVSG